MQLGYIDNSQYLTSTQCGLVGLTAIIFDALNYGIGKDMWNVSVADAARFSEVGSPMPSNRNADDEFSTFMTSRSLLGSRYSSPNYPSYFSFFESLCHLARKRVGYFTQLGLSSGSTSSTASPWSSWSLRNVSTSMRPGELHASIAIFYLSRLPLSM